MGYVRTFFEDKRTYDAVRKMCRNVFRNKEEAMDALHDLYLKLEENQIQLPDDLNEALIFMRRMVINQKIDRMRREKKFPEVADAHYAMLIEHDGGPGHAEQLDTLNILMVKKRGLFTEDQLTLWHCLYRDLSSEQMAIVMGKDPDAIYSLVYKLMRKIRKHIVYEELL
jgi:RNA polymerase sigma factor (sigma-70 family)